MDACERFKLFKVRLTKDKHIYPQYKKYVYIWISYILHIYQFHTYRIGLQETGSLGIFILSLDLIPDPSYISCKM